MQNYLVGGAACFIFLAIMSFGSQMTIYRFGYTGQQAKFYRWMRNFWGVLAILALLGFLAAGAIAELLQ